MVRPLHGNCVYEGTVKDWEKWEELVSSCMKTLLYGEPVDRPLVLADLPLSSYGSNQKAAQIIFEKIELPALHIGKPPTFALFASGRTTGAVLDLGYKFTQCSAISEGEVITGSVTTVKFGGRDLDQAVLDYFKSSGYRSCPPPSDAKHQLCYVAPSSEGDANCST